MNAARFAAGCDVVEVARLSSAIDRRAGLLERLFTDREIHDARRGGVVPGSSTERARLAARFAAKEAARKAVGNLRLPFHDVEVRSEVTGEPVLWIRGRRSSLVCSLSHDGGVALAVVVGTLVEDPLPAEGSLPSTRAADASHGASRGGG